MIQSRKKQDAFIAQVMEKLLNAQALKKVELPHVVPIIDA